MDPGARPDRHPAGRTPPGPLPGSSARPHARRRRFERRGLGLSLDTPASWVFSDVAKHGKYPLNWDDWSIHASVA
jgi:hypothetical protein